MNNFNLCDVEIIKADQTAIFELKSIWKVCFGDSNEYIDFFFKNCFDSSHAVAARYNNRIIAAMYLLPVTTKEFALEKKGFYAYAIGVLPEYRKTGVYRKMHSETYDFLLKNNMFCILAPANKKLCEYYKKIGFTENAYVCEELLKKEDGCSFDYELCDLDADFFFYSRYNSFPNAIHFNKDICKYILSENEFTGGKNYKVSIEKKAEYFVIMKFNAQNIIITESNIPHNFRQDFTEFICEKFNTENAMWINPPDELSGRQKILYGVSVNLKKDNYYLNHILN